MMKLSFTSTALLFCLGICGGCDKDPVAASSDPLLKTISTVNLSGVPEPSGLALDSDGNHLWSVSDQTGNVYRMTTGGDLVLTLEIGGQDLEGIAVDPVDGTLFVAEEGLGEVLHLDRNGTLLETLAPAGLPDMGNNGLEGITIDPNTGHIFVLKEKDPGILVEMDRSGIVLAQTELDFALDYSGLAFDAAESQLIIISDQSATLTWCTTAGQPVKTFGTGLDKGEGIVLDPALSVLYAVSDSKETLTTFEASE